MKTFSFLLIIFMSATSYSQGWKILESHNVAFSNKDVSGTFDDISGTIVFDAANLATAKFNFKLKVESINTGNGLQNKHARGDEWFHAEKYPYIEFESTKIEKNRIGIQSDRKIGNARC